MGNIGEEMTDKAAGGFFGFNIFLAAMRTESFRYNITAVKAGILFPELMFHPASLPNLYE